MTRMIKHLAMALPQTKPKAGTVEEKVYQQTRQGILDLIGESTAQDEDTIRAILRTYDLDLIRALSPRPKTTSISQSDTLLLLAKGHDHFQAALRVKIECADDGQTFVLTHLMEKVGKEPDVWFQTVLQYYTPPTYNAGSLTDLLYWARSKPLTSDQARLIAQILTYHQDTHPEDVTQAARSAAIGSCSFDLVALLLAGAKAPETPQNGPKVQAILDRATSAHGRLQLYKDLGPLDVFLKTKKLPLFDTDPS